jgi:AcrR family transcriptional regulator
MARLSNEQKALIDEMMQEKICTAATEVILEYGVQEMTMSKVAKAAGIAKGTIYNYFKDKKELMQVIADSIFKPLEQRIRETAASAHDPLDKLREIAGTLLETFNKYRKVFVLIHEANMIGMLERKSQPFEKRKVILGIIRKICDDAIAENIIKPENTETIAEVFLGMVMSINISKMTANIQRPVSADLETIMSIFTQGLQTKQQNEETVNE